MEKHLATPQTTKRMSNRKLRTIAGGLALVLLVTIGVALGTSRDQETYNGSNDILRMLETSAGIKITLYTTGIYADDGKFQQTDIIVIPKDLSKRASEIVFDAKMEYTTSDNTTITHIIKDSKAYTVERNLTGELVEADCARVPDLPRLDLILDTIINAKAVDKTSAFYQHIKCPKASQQLIHAVWEGLNYFYCFDSSAASLGSFLGPQMVASIGYLSTQEVTVESASIQPPEDVECDTIDLSELSIDPTTQISTRRRLAKDNSDATRCSNIRFGKCHYRYSCSQGKTGDESYANRPASGDDRHSIYGASWAFNELGINLHIYMDLPITGFGSDMYIYLRRKLKSVAGRDGYTCVYVHGAGVSAGPSVRDSYTSYWGKYLSKNPPCYCSSVKFIVLNTRDRPYNDPTLQSEFVAQLRQIRPSQATKYVIEEMVMFTHGTGGLMLSHAIESGRVKMSGKWYSIFTPLKGTHLPQYLRSNCPKNSFDRLIQKIARSARVRKSYIQCSSASKAGYNGLDTPASQDQDAFLTHVTKAACGVSVSHRTKKQNAFMTATTDEASQTSFLSLSDGMTRVGSCLDWSSDSETSAIGFNKKFTLLNANFWQGRMRRADRQVKGGGVRQWISDHADDFKSIAMEFAK